MLKFKIIRVNVSVYQLFKKGIIGHTDGDERDLQDLYCSFQKFTLSIPDGPDGMQKLRSQ